MKIIPRGGLTSAQGFRAAGLACGIKKSGRPDLALLVSDRPALSECATTKNLFAAAPVEWCRMIKNLRRPVLGVVVNSGNANAATGKLGVRNAALMAKTAAQALKAVPGDFYVSSTGVIGRQLPVNRAIEGIRRAALDLSPTGGPSFARAIMTTDLVSKECAVETRINGKRIRIGGCCKGSGMIHPNMATMLAYVVTDAVVAPAALKSAFQGALTRSFNRIVVDGDTSTNDTLIVLANGAAQNPVIRSGKALADFSAALEFVLTDLARKIVRDGEGATKFVTVTVKNARTEADADKAARAIALSPLVKTALFGNDPNWGRIMAAAGYSGANFDPARSSLVLCGMKLVRKGEPLPFDEKKAHSVLKKNDDIVILVDLGAGKAQATIYTCDFSYDYVKINAEYTT